MLFDVATSAIAGNKIRLAMRVGSPLLAGWVITRCTEMQTCPALANPPAATAAEASSRSASGMMITGQDAPTEVMRSALAEELGLPEEGIAVVGE